MHLFIYIYIYIYALDPQTGNIFVLISSVDVQRSNAFIRVQKGPWMTRQTDIKSQKARRRTDGQTYGHILLTIKGFESMACSRMHCAQL